MFAPMDSGHLASVLTKRVRLLRALDEFASR